MLLVILAWILNLVCLLGLGHLVMGLLGRADRNSFGAPHAYLTSLAGLAIVTASATVWNYMAPVGLWFQVAMLILAMGVIMANRRVWQQACTDRFAGWRKRSPWTKGACAALLLIALLKSIAPSEVFDEGGYFLPYIRWIEQYRIIPGLGNIEDRLGFNSAFHMASASFGLAWLIPGGVYKLNGLLLVLFGTWCLSALDRVLDRRRRIQASEVMKLLCLFFLMRNAVTSSAADLSNMLLAETVLILFMEKIESGTTTWLDRSFWIILITSLLVATIKLSSLLILLVPAYLALRIFLSGHRLPWIRMAVLSGFLFLPWLGRFPVLSGYLVYPVYQLDLLDVDWKVPHAVAKQQYHYVQEYAKTNTRAPQAIQVAQEQAFLDWVPRWFKRENAVNRGMALALALAWASLLAHGLFNLRRSFYPQHVDRTVFGLILLASVAFWFVSNPAFRFGWSWSIILVSFWLHAGLSRFHQGGALRMAILAVFALSLSSNTAKSLLESRSLMTGFWIKPASFPSIKTIAVRIGPLDARESATIQCWGEMPPCLPHDQAQRIEARGARITDGFRTVPTAPGP